MGNAKILKKMQQFPDDQGKLVYIFAQDSKILYNCIQKKPTRVKCAVAI